MMRFSTAGGQPQDKTVGSGWIAWCRAAVKRDCSENDSALWQDVRYERTTLPMIELSALVMIEWLLVVRGGMLFAAFSPARPLMRMRSRAADRRARAGGVLLAAPVALQLAHGEWLLHRRRWLERGAYAALLFVAAAAFFLFSSAAPCSRAESERAWRFVLFLPASLAFVLPLAVAIPLAFADGVAGATRLAVLSLQQRNARFRLERGVRRTRRSRSRCC